jgi:hypothetical protein
LCYFLNKRAAEKEMERLQSSAEPDTEVHATRRHEQTTWRDKATALAFADTSMDRDWSVEMQNYELIFDSVEGIFEW